jgi:raffinose/stachyose/melibiose transport system permease protein
MHHANTGRLWRYHPMALELKPVKTMPAKDKSRPSLGNWIITVGLAIFAFIQLFPLIWLMFFSLKDNNEIFGGNIVGLPTRFLCQNYQQAFAIGHVGLYFMNSILVTVITVIFSDILAAMASYGIIRMKWKLSKVVLTVFLLGLMITNHAALLPLFIILRNLGILNTYWALIIPYVAFSLPFSIFVLAGFLQSIPRELEESACLDGCNIYQTFLHIIVPMINPAIITVSIFTYLATWNELMFAVTFISKDEFKTLTVGVMSMVGQFTTSWGPIGAGLVIASIPTVIIYSLMSQQVQKSFTTGALKG